MLLTFNIYTQIQTIDVNVRKDEIPPYILSKYLSNEQERDALSFNIHMRFLNQFPFTFSFILKCNTLERYIFVWITPNV